MKHMRTALSVYSLIVGFGVIGIWVMILIEGNLKEGWMALGFHLFSEYLMALILLISGILMLRRIQIGIALNLIGLGMLLYSVINAAGYYGQEGNVPMLVMFVVLAFLTIGAIGISFLSFYDPSDS